jgi:hypothetical protein
MALAGARRRHKREWEHTLYMVQATQNIMAKRPEPLDALYRRVFRDTRIVRPMSADQIRGALMAVSVKQDGLS